MESRLERSDFALARAVRFYFFGDRTLSVGDVELFIKFLEEPKPIEAADPTIDADAGHSGDLESLTHLTQFLARIEDGLLPRTKYTKRLFALRPTPNSQDAYEIVNFSRYRLGSNHRHKIIAFAAFSMTLSALVNIVRNSKLRSFKYSSHDDYSVALHDFWRVICKRT
jgi:hypothetical protein